MASIWTVNMEQIGDIKEEIERCTKGLRSNAAKSNCCIYKVPSMYKENNSGHWYNPRIVSIGPYYCNGRALVGDYKYQCLGSFLSRAKGVTLADCMKKLHPLESEARQCYSKEIQIDLISSGEFLEMMLLDASFILVLFYKFQNPVMLATDEPLAHLRRRLPYFYVDLLLLQNQIPFFVLQELFDISKMPNDPPTLPLLALRFFNNVLRRPKEVIERYANPENPPLHLLDLVRSSLIHPMASHIQFRHLKQEAGDTRHTQIQSITCISRLRRSGISVQPCMAGSFLSVNFKHGVVEIPPIIINDFMQYLLLNCVAFEQCHNSCSKNVSAYATFLCCLVDNLADVEYLRESNVIDNYDVDRVAGFIKGMGKDLDVDIGDSYLSKVFHDVDMYYRNAFIVLYTRFTQRYFYTRWPFVSFLAATALLLLTIAQTYFAIIGYVYPKK